MVKALVLVTFFCFTNLANAQLYSTATGNIGFYSKTPVEDIEALSTGALGVMHIGKKELAFKVANTSFEFSNKLMQEHFNEKYMESEKFPESSFKGKINEDVNLATEGIYRVTVTGKLNIHGVEKERTLAGIITVRNNEININAEFNVLTKDHRIEIPKLVAAKIAEEIAVKLNVKMLPKN